MTEIDATLVLAVRHGETEWNLVGKQQGHMDSPLTELSGSDLVSCIHW